MPKKLDNLDKMDRFLEIFTLPTMNKEQSENLNKQIIPNEIEAAISLTPDKQKSWTGGLHR